MQRRGESGQPVKGQSANRPKARNAPTAQVSTAELQEQLDRRTRERDEALEQQRATSEVLRVISSSPGELEPVFRAVLENATRICEAKFGTLHLQEGDVLRPVATHNAPPAYIEARMRDPLLRPPPDAPLGRVAITKQVVHIADIKTTRSYIERHPFLLAVDLAGYRTILAVPMLKESELIGAIVIFRQEVRPFSDKQIELVQNFAAQAVIAIDNARLLSELRESLQQQTATAEVLKVISSSPGELEPVFQEMLSNAMQICEAKFGILFEFANGAFRALSSFNLPPAFAEYHNEARVWGPDTGLGRLASTKKTVHVKDTQEGRAFTEGDAGRMAAVELGGVRTFVAVPMLKEGELIGAFIVHRQEVRPFTDKQIELVSNFAAQAVIAIENARLLSELRESLQQQTATADVLKVISSSPGQLEPVFNAMLENAVKICGAKFGMLYRSEGDGSFRTVAMHDVPRAFSDRRGRNPVVFPPAGTPLGRIMRTRQVAHIADIRTEPGYADSPPLKDLADLGGARTLVAVPMLKDNELVGAIVIYRQEVRPFSDKQIELLTNFAAQAVIAIENTRLLNELRHRTDDLSESLEQQTATSEVLGVISSSPGELEPVFNAMLENAVRICGAKFGNLWLREGAGFRIGATQGAPQAYADFVRSLRIFQPDPRVGLGTIIRTKQPLQTEDVAAVPTHGDKTRQALVELAGARTLVAVPMLKDDEVIGAIGIYRQEVRPFTDKQIELVKNFAAQAVIAIENTRLLNELRQRTHDLSEALEQQTATSEVLQVISSSPGELKLVFEAMLANATRLCEAKFGILFRLKDGAAVPVATLGVPEAFMELIQRSPLRPSENAPIMRAARTKQIVHVVDFSKEQVYIERDPMVVVGVEVVGIRTLLVVPMLKDDEFIGSITIFRQEVRPFTDKQIELVSNFAKQAVIAIENTRLLNELRESLQQQTATSEVLQVISGSAGELQPVFDAMLENAVRICGAKFGSLLLVEGDAYRNVALYGAPQAFLEERQRHPIISPRPGSDVDRVRTTKQIIHIADMQVEGAATAAIVELAGARTFLNVPMLKDDELIGVIGIYRQEVHPFTDKQIELVKNFAAQAVIAIENTRLLNELRESLQQQTATADVLKVISRSTFDLQTVLHTLVESAARLSDADSGTITRERNGAFYRAEAYGFSKEFMDYVQDIPIKPEKGSASGRALLEGRLVHIADVEADPEYTWSKAQQLGDFRTILAIPMLREGVPIGVLTLTRTDVRPFTDKQIELVATFADQAAIAIENVRLFESVEARTRELAASLENLRTTQDRLVQTQKLASLGQLTAGIAHEIKNPLNFVNNFSGVSAELIDELQEALKDVSLNEKRRSEITELMDTLRGNLDKVMQHGKRADAIVKNMLLHSREGSGEHRLVDINALVEEGLNLAYHGARAEKQGFNITLEKSFDPTAGEADVFPQEITRALLNLISNGFYAATKRKVEVNGGDYEPTLTAATKSLGDRVEIRIRDNGTGIPPEVKDKLFNPFFTTKPAGEGTGLGLSISHDIIVKQHGGSIEVDTQPGEFTEFRIVLPRAALGQP